MATAAAALSSLSSLSIQASSTRPSVVLAKPTPNFSPLPRSIFSIYSKFNLSTRASSSDIDTSLFDNQNPEEEIVYDPPTPPEGFVPPPYFDEDPEETEEQIAAAYEGLYGPAYSGQSLMGNDVYVMDSKLKKGSGWRSKEKEKIRDGFEETVLQVRTVAKTVKGGRQLQFRAVMVVGDKQGQVGVGVGKAKEVITAVQKAAINARRNVIKVPMTKYLTFPHRADGDFGAARVMLRPASPGTGVIAGGTVRTVLEMAGVQNALGKQLGSNNCLNNARAAVVAIQKMRQFRDVARERGIPMEELWK